MKWFKKSSPEHPENQHKEQKHRRIKKTSESSTENNEDYNKIMEDDIMSRSLSAIPQSSIEVLDPEEFFQDPDHVRNYKEEALFLNMMSEWVIIEDPALLSENYFSADFEDELLQMKTQDPTATTSITISNNELESGLHESHTYVTDNTFAETNSCNTQQLPQKEQSALRRGCKRRFYEFIFTDNIQTGIPLLKRTRQTKTKKRSQKSAVGLVKISNSDSNNYVKDSGIDRAQLKTEALACSIMGAIGKCPDKDMSPSSSECDLSLELQQQHELNAAAPAASTHTTHSTSCDHYDIKHFFRLDDNGNILLNINHIEESKGWGFAVAHNKRLYRRYRKQCQFADESVCFSQNCLHTMQNLLDFLWNMMCCHPRNKINIYGSGTGDSLRIYTLQLAADQCSTFARNIENFISCTKESREAAPQVVMRNMRQFMNGMKNYLVKHGEGKFHQEVEAARARLKADEFLNLDAILETVMHQLVVLPLREHLYGMFVDYYTRSEDIQLLAQNVKYACGRNAADFGIRPTVTPPSSSSLNVISNLLLRLQEAELPLDKLELFLCVISTIFDATGCPRGQQLGADDFLPVLVYVVAKCGFVGAEIEAEFMWGLLQPTLLNGEPGYYLTALCSAVHVLKSFMASENESGTGSLDWRSSSLPACSSVLRVIIPDECNGSLQTRTLPVRPHTTTREVCRIIAHKARITNPQDYALFKLVDGEETLLSDQECPQDIRLAAKGKHCMLAYKRIDAKIAWPTTTTQQNSN